jgi:S1-C subfamily serine protease
VDESDPTEDDRLALGGEDPSIDDEGATPGDDRAAAEELHAGDDELHAGDDELHARDDEQDTRDDAQDDLDGLDAAATARRRRLRWLALLLAVLLAVPFSGWLIDELGFRSAGREVAGAVDEALVDSVLLVRAGRCDGTVVTGTAFVLALDDGPVVVTNRHVVEQVRTAGVRPLTGGPPETVTEVRLAADADVAVLEVAAPGRLPTALQPGGAVEVGTELRLVGFPAARAFTTTGTVRAADPELLRVELATDPGASGSPLVAGDGRVAGQIFARSPRGEGLATPIARLLTAVETATVAPDC